MGVGYVIFATVLVLLVAGEEGEEARPQRGEVEDQARRLGQGRGCCQRIHALEPGQGKQSTSGSKEVATRDR